jgi:hypothetical protein
MTREEIEQMPAGRELDVLVHFALHPTHKPQMGAGFYAPESDRYRQVPHYSSDIAAAWHITEILEPRGYLVDITRRKDFDTSTYPYECEIWDTSAGPDMRALAPTAPLALCRAALLSTL